MCVQTNVVESIPKCNETCWMGDWTVNVTCYVLEIRARKLEFAFRVLVSITAYKMESDPR